MRYLLILAVLFTGFISCNKDKFTTAPQIKFKSINPDNVTSGLTFNNKDLAPKITIHITDAEGDIGLTGKDTARVFIKNLLSNKVDSFNMPALQSATSKNFEADVEINLYNTLYCRPGGPPRPRTDTTFYEVYVKDFAKNKSNVVTTDKPLYMRCL